jgi:uroporphyrinogen decarboxylase
VCSALGLPREEDITVQLHTQLVFPSEAFMQRFGSDVRSYYVPRDNPWKPLVGEQEGFLEYRDEWAVLRRMPASGGHYFDPRGSRLTEARTAGEVEAHPWPRYAEQARPEKAPEELRSLREQSDAAILLGPICAGLFEAGGILMGHAAFFTSLAADEAVACALMEKVLEMKVGWLERVLPVVGGLVDVVAEFDDVAGQNGPLVSPSMYRRLVKPLHRELFSTIRRLTGAPIFLHCCGDVTAFLDDFIEMGVSIINPVQVSAAHMEPQELKRRWGKDITFWGGIDTQRIMPHGRPHDVRREVKRRIDELGVGGGYVAAAVHDLQSDVPAENIIALRDAVRQFGRRR